MCTPECIGFVQRALTELDVKGKRLLEVGSYDVNGSVRRSLEAHDPATYVGIDISDGPGVDIVCDVVSQLPQRFDPGCFDIVLSTEAVEHIRDWRAAFTNMKRVCAPGGVIVITTRSPGFGYHAFPHDYWRYQPTDMALIFCDFDIELLESEQDREQPGVFVKARKPEGWIEIDLTPISLYSIVTDSRRQSVTDRDIARYKLGRQANHLIRPLIQLVPQKVKAPLKKRLPRPSA